MKVPVHVSSADFTYPTSHAHLKEPIVLTQWELSGHVSAAGVRHSSMSESQLTPPQPGLHVHSPFTLSQVWVLSSLHVHFTVQLIPYVPDGHAGKEKYKLS